MLLRSPFRVAVPSVVNKSMNSPESEAGIMENQEMWGRKSLQKGWDVGQEAGNLWGKGLWFGDY